MAVIVKFGDIEGEMTLAEHVGWCQAHRFRWRGSRRMETDGGQRAASHRKYDLAIVTKPIDSGSPLLIQSLVERIPMEIKVHFSNVAGATAGNKSYEIIFTNGFVAAFEYDFVGDNLVEEISIGFESFAVTYFNQDSGEGMTSFSDDLIRPGG